MIVTNVLMVKRVLLKSYAHYLDLVGFLFKYHIEIYHKEDVITIDAFWNSLGLINNNKDWNRYT
jgi:hypothetical protein